MVNQWKVICMGRQVLSRLGVAVMGFLAVLKLGGALSVTLSMLISLFVYAAAFGFKFAFGFMILLFVHELGHIAASRIVGLRAVGPVFIPFIGAVIRLNRKPVNSKMSANIAIGGPAAGTVSALICLAFYFWTDSVLMLVLAYTACLLNLFNLIPCPPLDGERVASAISPRLWWAGSFALGFIFVYTYNILIFLVFIFSLLQLWQGKNSETDEFFYLTKSQRLTVAWWYFGIVGVLAFMTWYIAGLLDI